MKMNLKMMNAAYQKKIQKMKKIIRLNIPLLLQLIVKVIHQAHMKI